MPQKRDGSPVGPNTLNISPVSLLTQKLLTQINILASSKTFHLYGHRNGFTLFQIIMKKSHQLFHHIFSPLLIKCIVWEQYFKLKFSTLIIYAQYWKVNKSSPTSPSGNAAWIDGCQFGWNTRRGKKTTKLEYAFLLSHLKKNIQGQFKTIFAEL